MQLDSIAQGKQYNSVLQIGSIIKTVLFNYTPSEKDNTYKQGEAVVEFAFDFFENQIKEVKLVWIFKPDADNGEAIRYADPKEYTFRKTGTQYTCGRVQIPGIREDQHLLYKKGDIFLEIEIPGLVPVQTGAIGKFDAGVSLYYAHNDGQRSQNPIESKKEFLSKIKSGDKISFQLEPGDGLSHMNWHTYLLFIESDLSNPTINDYEVKRLPANGVLKTRVTTKPGHPEQLGAILEMRNNRADWIVGLSGDTIVLDKTEAGPSPDQFEWIVLLVMNKNPIRFGDSYTPLSDYQDMIFPYYDVLTNLKPGMKVNPKLILHNQSDPEFSSAQFLNVEVEFENLNTENWLKPSASIVKKNDKTYVHTNDFSVNLLSGNTNRKSFLFEIRKKRRGEIENNEYYICFTISKIFEGTAFCKGLLNNPRIKTVSYDHEVNSFSESNADVDGFIFALPADKLMSL